MRKIKFRALQRDQHFKGWVFADIETGFRGSDIDNKTICQYIGLEDKNGKEIYENDIVKIHKFFCQERDQEKFKDRFNIRGTINYCNSGFKFFSIDLINKHISKDGEIYGSDLILEINEENAGSDMSGSDEIDSNDLEIIGNAHENPELLN
jgi:uncharacterized phage protein (TIGR01671 family)